MLYFVGDKDSQCIFTLTLKAVRVDGGRWEAHIEKVVINIVGSLLGLDEDESARWRHREQQVVQSLLLLFTLNEDDLVRSALVVDETTEFLPVA